MTINQELLAIDAPLTSGTVAGARRQFASMWLSGPLQSLATRLSAYCRNFLSGRFLGYQFLGGIGSVAVKFLLPMFGVLDHTGYGGALALQMAGAGGHFLVQFPAYVYFEHRRYGQPVGSLIREYFAWRIPELLLGPGRYFDALQANQTGGFLGDSFGAAATSLPLSLGQLASLATAPITQGIYRRLQLRKEQGVSTGAGDVYRIVCNGLARLQRTPRRAAGGAGRVLSAAASW